MKKAYVSQISRLAEKAISDQVFPGCSIGFSVKGERTTLVFGRQTYEENSPRVKTNTVYDVASLTKSLVTGSLALYLLDQKQLELHAPVTKYLPDFSAPYSRDLQIFHLLTFTVGGLPLSNLKELSPAESTQRVFTEDVPHAPGSRFLYGNLPSFLLGLVVESILKEPIDHAAERVFFRPLTMRRTAFNILRNVPLEEIAPTEICPWRKSTVRGVVHDESAYNYAVNSNRFVGHAGLFSTAPDVLTFMEMMVGGGVYDGVTYLSPAIVEEATSNQIAHLDACTGLGWELNQAESGGKHRTARTFSKTGFTGCFCLGDQEKQVALAILSNRTYPHRPPDGTAIQRFRREVADLLLQ